MAKLNRIPYELVNEINDFFSYQSAEQAERDIFEMFIEYISRPNSFPEDNASKALTYKQIASLLKSLEKHFIKGKNPPIPPFSLN